MHVCQCGATCDSPRLHRRRSPSAKATGDKHFNKRKRGGSGERGRASGKRQQGNREEEAVEFAGANELNPLRREQLRRDRGAVAERAKPVAKRAVFGSGWLRRGSETRVVIGVLMHHRHGIVVAVVGRVPAAQRARQGENDRKCDERL